MLTRTETPPHSRYMLTRTETPPTKRTNDNERKRKPDMTIMMLTYMYFYGKTHTRTSCGEKSQRKKKQKQHSSQQKQHNRKSTQHIICIYSSVAISAHCCLHWCSHLTSVPPSSIGVRTLPFTFRWSQLCRLIVSLNRCTS